MRSFNTFVEIEESDIKEEYLVKVFELLSNTIMDVNKGALDGQLFFNLELEAVCRIVPFDRFDPDDEPSFQDFGLFMITGEGLPVSFNRYLTDAAWDRIEEEVMDEFYRESDSIDFREGDYE